MLQTMSATDRKRTLELSGRVCAVTCVKDDYTRVISSGEFYKKQISWCIKTVATFWEFIRVDRHGVCPTRVHMTIRFCISCLSGRDCTNWTARQVFHGFNKLSVPGNLRIHSCMLSGLTEWIRAPLWGL